MLSNLEEQGSHSKDLAKDLEKSINESLQEFRTKLKEKRQVNEILPPLLETSKKSRNLTTTLVQVEIINFNFPENHDMEHFKYLGGVMSMLESWKVECRQRESLFLDMYYSHASSCRKFRSIPEVVNHILPKGYPKIKTRVTRKKVKNETSSPLVICNYPHNTEDKGIQNLEAQNRCILPQSILGLANRKLRGRPRKIKVNRTLKKLKESTSPANNIIEVEITSSDEILPNLPIVQVTEENMILTLQHEESEQTQQDFANNDNVMMISTTHGVRNDSSETLQNQPEMQLAVKTMNLAFQELEDVLLIEEHEVRNYSSQIVPYQQVQTVHSVPDEHVSLEPELLATLQRHSFPVEDWMYDDL